jgi:multidrug transporter EmrE-like cation transporter
LTFSLTLAQIDVGIAYAVWSACGTAFVSALGVMLFGERMDLYKISCLGIIILGVIGLNLREVVVRR